MDQPTTPVPAPDVAVKEPPQDQAAATPQPLANPPQEAAASPVATPVPVPPSTTNPPKPPKKPAGPKGPGLTIGITMVIFVVLAAAAYYAYTKSK